MVKPILRKNQKGQALLVVLLGMAVVLTILLSVASRSITDVSVTTFEEDALRAFSAAEAGVERSLLTGTGGSGSPDPGDTSLTYTTTVGTTPEGLQFKYPGILNAGESATFWFVRRDNSGNFTCSGGCFTGPKINSLCWGGYPSYSPGEEPAVRLSIFYDWNAGTSSIGNIISSGDFTHLKVAYQGYDPNDSRNDSNNFLDDTTTGPLCAVGGTTFSYKRRNIFFSPGNPDNLSIPTACRNTPGCLIMAKMRVFYNDTSVADDPVVQPEQVALDVGGGTSLPPQGNRIESTGEAGESTRRVEVFQGFPEPPPIFDAAVFSLSDVSK